MDVVSESLTLSRFLNVMWIVGFHNSRYVFENKFSNIGNMKMFLSKWLSKICVPMS